MSELSPDALKTALDRHRITDGSRLAGQLEADPEALRTLARLALAHLPAGPAAGEDEAAWATLAEADPLTEVEVPPATVAPPPAFAGLEVVAPMAPLAIRAPRSYGWVWGLVAGMGLVLGGLGTWWMMTRPGEEGATDSALSRVAAAPASAGAVSGAAPASVAVAPASDAPASMAAAPESVAMAAPESRAERRPAAAAGRPVRRGGGAEEAPEKPAAAPSAAPATAAARKPRGGDTEVDDLLGSLDGNRAAKPAGTPDFNANPNDPLLPERLSRQQILLVVKQGAGKVRGCKAQSPDATGTVMVALVIESKGTASGAVQGPYKGTPVGDCVEQAVRTFKFPQFRGEPMRINMPFGL